MAKRWSGGQSPPHGDVPARLYSSMVPPLEMAEVIWLIDPLFPFYLHVPITHHFFLSLSGYISPEKKGLDAYRAIAKTIEAFSFLWYLLRTSLWNILLNLSSFRKWMQVVLDPRFPPCVSKEKLVWWELAMVRGPNFSLI